MTVAAKSATATKTLKRQAAAPEIRPDKQVVEGKVLRAKMEKVAKNRDQQGLLKHGADRQRIRDRSSVCLT